jgi:hypothetical protein
MDIQVSDDGGRNRRRATTVARSLRYRALYLGHETGGVVAPLGDVTALL